MLLVAFWKAFGAFGWDRSNRRKVFVNFLIDVENRENITMLGKIIVFEEKAGCWMFLGDCVKDSD